MCVAVSSRHTNISHLTDTMHRTFRTAPYKAVEYAASGGHRSVFALVHADITVFLVKVEQLRHIFNVSQRQGNAP